jgi:hypothetical protein
MDVRKELLEQVVSGNARAWQQLVLQIEALIERRVRWHPAVTSRFGSSVARDADCVRDVFQMALERLANHDYANIQSFLDGALSLPNARFEVWLRTLTDFVIRDYLTRRYGSSRIDPNAASGEKGARGHAGLHKRDVGSFAERLLDEDQALARAPGLSDKITGTKLLEYAQATFSRLEWGCLEDYLLDFGYEELAARWDLASPTLAEQLVRKLKQRLRSCLMDGRVSRHWMARESHIASDHMLEASLRS